jgi:hypothetical protein
MASSSDEFDFAPGAIWAAEQKDANKSPVKIPQTFSTLKFTISPVGRARPAFQLAVRL